MANEINIPSLDIAQRGILGMSSPQVTVAGQGSQSIIQDPNFAGLLALSKTASQAGAIAANLVPLEGEQKKTKQQYEKVLQDHVNSLVGRGMVSEEEAYEIIRAEEGRIQREGLIKAYDSFVFTDEIDKERTEIRVRNLQEYVNSRKQDLTNPTRPVPLDTVIDEGINALQIQGVFGTDAANNGVGLDLSEMTSGEQMLFMSGVHQMRLGLDQAIAEVREARTIEASTKRWKNKVFDTFELYRHQGDPKLFEDTFQLGYDLNVPDINAEFMASIEYYGETLLSKPNLSPEDYNYFHQLVRFASEDLLSRQDATGKRYFFAGRGTKNAATLEEIKDKFVVEWDRKQTAQAKQAVAIEEQKTEALFRYAVDKAFELSEDGRLTEEERRELNMEVIRLSRDGNVIDVDKVISRLDTTYDNMMFVPSDDIWEAETLNDIDSSSFDTESLNEIENNALGLLKDGKISSSNFDKVRTAINGKRRDIESNKAASLAADAEKEGGFGMRADISQMDRVMRGYLARNDIRYNEGTMSYPNYETYNTHDNIPNHKYVVELELMDNKGRTSVIQGGSIDNAPGVTPFTEKEINDLKLMGYSEFEANEAFERASAELNWDTPISSYEEIRSRSARKNEKISQTAVYFSLRQALERMPEGTWTSKTKK